MLKQSITSVLVVLMLSLSVSAGWFDFTGKVTETNCIDSDNSPDYFGVQVGPGIGKSDKYVKGNVEWQGYGTATDNCVNINTNQFSDKCETSADVNCGVQEYYCHNGERGAFYLMCENGCQEGKCLKEGETFTISTCPSSAETNAIISQCKARGIKDPLTGLEYEYYIESGCNKVRCVSQRGTTTQPTAACTDSDGGKNYNVKGTVSGYSSVTDSAGKQSNQIVTFDDCCISSSEPTGKCVAQGDSLVERYCQDNYWNSFVYHACDCQNGVCLNEPAQQPTSKQLPLFVIAIGETAPSSDIILATNIGADIAFKGYTGSPPEGISKLFNEVSPSKLSDKLVLVLCKGDGILVKGTDITPEQDAFSTDLTTILNTRGVGFYTILSSKVSSMDQLCPSTTIATTCPSAEETQLAIQKCKDAGLERETQIGNLDANGCVTVKCEKTATPPTSVCPSANETALQIQKCKDAGLEKETQIGNLDANGCVTVTCGLTAQPTCPSDSDVLKQIETCTKSGLDYTSNADEKGCKTVVCVAKQAAPICSGCSVGDTCLPIGTRKSGQYCDIDNKMKDVVADNLACSNNFECLSNLCVNDSCVAGNVWQKFLSWIAGLFGG